jgi:hypothetical protein
LVVEIEFATQTLATNAKQLNDPTQINGNTISSRENAEMRR